MQASRINGEAGHEVADASDLRCRAVPLARPTRVVPAGRASSSRELNQANTLFAVPSHGNDARRIVEPSRAAVDLAQSESHQRAEHRIGGDPTMVSMPPITIGWISTPSGA